MTDEKEITDFIEAANHAIDGKSIVAEKRISSLLRTIAASDRLIEVFKTVTRNYDFRTEFNRACDKVGSRGKLVMPSTPAAFLAFAFCLLMEIDAGKRSLRELVDEFYRAPNANEQYAMFASAVLVPFRDVTEYVFYNGVEGTSTDSAVNETALVFLREMNASVNRSNVEQNRKQEFYALTQGLERAVTDDRAEYFYPLLIGIKFSIRALPEISDVLTPIFNALLGSLT